MEELAAEQGRDVCACLSIVAQGRSEGFEHRCIHRLGRRVVEHAVRWEGNVVGWVHDGLQLFLAAESVEGRASVDHLVQDAAK